MTCLLWDHEQAEDMLAYTDEGESSSGQDAHDAHASRKTPKDGKQVETGWGIKEDQERIWV